MPILRRDNAETSEGYPGVPRATLVGAEQGAQSLWVGHLEVGPGATITTHIHPDTEEAMVIVEGELEAVLGDEVVTLGPGDTVLAPATRCWPRPASSTASSTAPTARPPFLRCFPRRSSSALWRNRILFRYSI